MNLETIEKAITEKRAEIARLQAVSQDTAYREGFVLSAMERAFWAAKEDKVFLSGEARGVLVIGISSLGPEKAEKFIQGCGGWKSHVNNVLALLDGEKGEIRRNKAETCWIIDLASPRRTTMFVWFGTFKQFSGPRLNTTNGCGHWIGLVSASMPLNRDANPKTVKFIQESVACLAAHGMTLEQWRPVQQRLEAEEAKAKAEAETAAREATRLAAWEARIMAELEAEQAAALAVQAAAAAQAKAQREAEVTCQVIGISVEEWNKMTPKQQALALHRARLAHKI